VSRTKPSTLKISGNGQNGDRRRIRNGVEISKTRDQPKTLKRERERRENTSAPLPPHNATPNIANPTTLQQEHPTWKLQKPPRQLRYPSTILQSFTEPASHLCRFRVCRVRSQETGKMVERIMPPPIHAHANCGTNNPARTTIISNPHRRGLPFRASSLWRARQASAPFLIFPWRRMGFRVRFDLTVLEVSSFQGS
jgi:hypothetical protein